MSHEEQTQTEQAPKKFWNKKILIPSIVGGIVVIILAFLAWLYTGSLNSTKQSIFTKLPLPAAIIDTKLLTTGELLERLALAKKLGGENQEITSEIKDQIYTQLIESKKITAIAEQRDVVVTEEEINTEYKNVIAQFAGGDEEKFKSELLNVYGISVDQFKKDVLKQDLLQSNLAVWYNNQESLNTESYKTARDLMSKIDSGQSFEDVAKQFNQDEASQQFEGDQGFVLISALLPEFRRALEGKEAGSLVLVPSRFGLHIIKLKERNTDEAGQDQVYIQQIFLQQSNFANWYKGEADKIRTVKLIKQV